MMLVAAALAGATLWLLWVPAAVIARFGALVLVGFYLPGRLLVPRDVGGRERVAAALALGLSAAGLVWALGLLLGLPPAATWTAMTAGAAVSIVVRPPRLAAAAPNDLAVAAAILACTAAVALTQFGNAVPRPGAELRLFTTYPPEALYQCAIAQELRHSLPMRFPAGASFGYHVLYNVLAAITAEATGASMLDVHYRLLPLLLVPLAALAAIAFAEALGAPPRAAALGAVFLFFADDLSWIFGAAGFADRAALGGDEWNLLLSTPIVYGLHHNRAFLAGVPASLAALMLAARYVERGGRTTLAATALLVATAVEYKVSFGFLLLAAIAVTAAATRLRGERAVSRRAAALAATSLAAALPVAFFIARDVHPGSSMVAVLPAYPALATLVRLGVFPGWAALKGALRPDPLRFAALWGPIAVALYTAGTLGVRAIGLEKLRRLRSAGPLTLLAAALVIVGWATTLVFATQPAPLNTVYFWGTSLCVLAVLAGAVAGERLAAPPRSRRLAACAALAALALPGTVQLIAVDGFWNPPFMRIPAAAARASEALAARARPGDVILEPDVDYSFFAAAAPVRPVIAWPQFLRYVLGEQSTKARLADVRAFFRERGSAPLREILERYRVSWVWIPADAPGDPSTVLPELRREFATEAGTLYRVAHP